MRVTPVEFAQTAHEAGYTLLPAALGSVFGTESLSYGADQTVGYKNPFDRFLIYPVQSEGRPSGRRIDMGFLLIGSVHSNGHVERLSREQSCGN